MKNSKFLKDLSFGKAYEKEAFKYFPNSTSFEFSVGRDKRYDVKFLCGDKEAIFVEVKADRLGKKTGNIAIEYECNNLPSGISTTTSDYWLYFVEEVGVFKFPIKELRTLFFENNFRKVSGGDGWRSRMKLIPITSLEKWRVDIMSCQQEP